MDPLSKWIIADVNRLKIIKSDEAEVLISLILGYLENFDIYL